LAEVKISTAAAKKISVSVWVGADKLGRLCYDKLLEGPSMTIEIDEWLEDLDLGKYIQVFAENEIDFAATLHLSDADLKELGLPMGPRRKVLAAITELSNQKTIQETGERRQVTALFADISGFTRLSASLDAEETHALLNAYFAAVDEIVQRFGGNVDKHIGDAVMAVFGAPVAHTDDPQRALAAALEIHTAATQLQPPLKVHIGIASGQVVASATGSAAHREYTVTGDSVNLAARLTDRAAAGETLVSASVQRALDSRFVGESLGEQMIEGLLEPITIWRMTGAADGAVISRHALVGRQREIDQFASALQDCRRTGGGASLIIRGEAGIGKTHLTESFVNMAEAEDFAVHTGLVLDFGTAKGQDAIRALVRSLMALPPGSDKTKRTAAADRLFSEGGLPEDRRVYLNDLLDLTQPANLNGLYQAMDNQTRNRGKQETLGILVRRASSAKPVLVRIEDVHWAEPVILAHLAHLAGVIRDVPVLMVMTTRIAGDRLDEDWREKISGASVTTLELGPLPVEEARDLAREFETVDETVIAACVERCGGNPLFLEQLLRNAEDLDAGNIPGSIQSIVQARLDVLPAAEQEAIQAASVLGQRFSDQALVALLEREGLDLLPLVSNALIRPAGRDYHFSHALIREGIYASMLRPRREELHRRAAQWFQNDDPILRAEHLDKADDPEAATAYLVAADLEAGFHRHERARQLTERGLQLEGPPDVHFDLTCRHGDLLRETGQAEASLAAFGAALEAVSTDDQTCRANIGMAEGLRITAKYSEGLEYASAAVNAANSAGSDEYLSRAHSLKGAMHFPLGQVERCIEEHDKALVFGQRAGSADAQARAYSGVADAHYNSGRMLSAAAMFERCVDTARQNNLARIIAANLAMLAATNTYALKFGENIALSEEAIETSVTIGDYRAEVLARGSACYFLIQLGRHDQALEASQRAAELAQKTGLTAFIAANLRHKSYAYLEKGQLSHALAEAEQAWELIVKGGTARFTGPLILGIIARASTDPKHQDWAIDEGYKILEQGAVAHNHLFFNRDVMEHCLGQNDWVRLDRATDALEYFTKAEPLPWSNFFIARARALRDFQQGQHRDDAIKTLRQLKQQAEQVGLTIALPRINEALADAGF